VDELIRQIRAASAGGLYYLALFGALALPDICGALGSDNGRATGSKYKAWLRDNVRAQANQADLIYGLRCSLIHQSSAHPHGSQFPIAFAYPTAGQIHNISTVVNGDRVGWLSIPMFVDEVCTGAETWMAKFGNTNIVVRNYEKFARFRPDGLPPHASGPIIALLTRPSRPMTAAPRRVGPLGPHARGVCGGRGGAGAAALIQYGSIRQCVELLLGSTGTDHLDANYRHAPARLAPALFTAHLDAR
jgi:hypothetical protein